MVNFEREAILKRCVLIYIEPRTIRAGLSLLTIVDDPLVVVMVLRVVHTLYMALYLGKQLVADVDVTVRRPADCYFSLTVLHLVLTELELLTWARYSKILQSQNIVRLAEFLSIWWLHLYKDVHVSDVHEHVWFERSLSRVHLLEDTKANFKIPNEVLFRHSFIENLEMPTIVLFTLRLISERDYEIVHYNLLFTSGVIHHWLSIIRLVVQNISS